ncbi:MAG: DUF1579 domain-containing protein [Alphaproteobacteria bacterium]|nr:DUF1579 domain-containing protein [Alphaproteobacteria bacterium]
MKKLVSAAALSLIAGANFALADEQQGPSPEAQRLGYYIGTWEGHGESKGGPFGPPGALSSKFTCERFDGGFQVVCRGEEHGPTGSQKFLNIKSYDDTAKSYSEYSISSLGSSEYATGGSIVGNKLTYIREIGDAKEPVKIRYSEEYLSPMLLAYKAEASVKGGPWRLIAEGKIKKIK